MNIQGSEILGSSFAENNSILGNFIGTDVTGTRALGNYGSGITIGGEHNTVGGQAAGARNVISGNVGGGVFLGLGSSNTVQGNLIGTTATGTQDLGNTGDGIRLLNSSGNLIGGATAAARNIISGNEGSGISIEAISRFVGLGANNNVVQGNFIGTDISGVAELGNTSQGIAVINAPSTTIVENMVSANGRSLSGTYGAGTNRDGIIIAYQSSGTVVQGNKIGVNLNGVALGNTGNGVTVLYASGVTVGGGSQGQGNTIANNDWNGVLVVDFAGVYATGDVIRGNSISANGMLGIDLSRFDFPYDGITANDAGDSDVGANNLQNFPLIVSATSTANTSTITGTLNSTPSTAFTLDFYSNVTADPSGFGEGAVYLGSGIVTTDITGNASYSINLPIGVLAGHKVTATATSASGTSEFGGNTIVVAQNTSPTSLSLSLDQATIRENDVVKLSGTFVDSDLLDTHIVTIRWGDGSEDTVLNLAAGVVSFSNVAHQYLDDNPSGTSSDLIAISVTVVDSYTANALATTNVRVNNVAPVAFTHSIDTSDVNENDVVTLAGSFVDIGSQDRHTLNVNWGDGIQEIVMLDTGSRSFRVSHRYLDNAPSGTIAGQYVVRVSLNDDDLGVATSDKEKVFGLKSENAGQVLRSRPPVRLYSFDSDGTGFTDIGTVAMNRTPIDVDGLAQSPRHGLLAFQVFTATAPVTASALVSINPANAVATLVGPTLTGRNLRGATFDHNDRLWAIDATSNELVEIDPVSGLIIGSPIGLTWNASPFDLGDGTDTTVRNNGEFLLMDFNVNTRFFALDRTTGQVTLIGTDTVPQAPNSVTFVSGAAFTNASGSDLFAYEANGLDDIYRYDSSLAFARTLVFGNIIPSFNSGRGDLAALVGFTSIVTVRNVAPTAIPSTNSNTYGTAATATLSHPFDPSSVDTNAGFRYAFSLDTDTNGSATYANSGTSDSANFGILNAGTYTVYARIIDKNGGFTPYSFPLTITPATLTIRADANLNTAVQDGFTKVYGASDPTLTYQVVGLVSFDTAATVLSGGLSRIVGEVVGTYNVNQGTLISTQNYTIVFTGSTLKITAAGTSVALTTSAPVSVPGMAVTFTASVSPAISGVGVPTGTVTFMDGLITLGTAVMNGGIATFTTSSLAVGNHSMKAVYNGDGNFDTSFSQVLVQTVNSASGTSVKSGQTATIGFWQNKNGQALIRSLNGSSNSIALGNWLAINFSNLYGSGAGSNKLSGKTNSQIAAFYKTLFDVKGQKLDAQVLATALAIYVTTSSLSGNVATPYGFVVTSAGTGASAFNVGNSGAAFGVANGTVRTVLQILQAANQQAANGVLYNGNSTLRNQANSIFDGINQAGDIL